MHYRDAKDFLGILHFNLLSIPTAFNKFEINVTVKVFLNPSVKYLTLIFTAIGRPSHKIVGFCAAVLAPLVIYN